MTSQRQNNDAAFCDRIPLHQTNLIQPHGVLVVADKIDLSVIQISTNASLLFELEPKQLINKPLNELIDEKSFHDLKQKSGDSYFKYSQLFTLLVRKNDRYKKHLSLIHEKDGFLLIEIDLKNVTDNLNNDFISFYQQIQHFMSAINLTSSVKEVAAIAAKEIKALSGFDKVMIYSFDEEWNGTVIAEEMEPGMESYLGLKFPATDIPKQARDLYLRNPYRTIPNRDYKAIPLIPELNTITNDLTNLADCKLRSVINVHREYLKNMNVRASMSTRIIHKEQL